MEGVVGKDTGAFDAAYDVRAAHTTLVSEGRQRLLPTCAARSGRASPVEKTRKQRPEPARTSVNDAVENAPHIKRVAIVRVGQGQQSTYIVVTSVIVIMVIAAFKTARVDANLAKKSKKVFETSIVPRTRFGAGRA